MTSAQMHPDTQTAFTQPAPLITLVSASGGCGKSTLALMMAHSTAHAEIDTALLEGDLQFGDMGFWLGLPSEAPSLARGGKCDPITVSNHLDLYKAPTLPELAEEISDEIARFVPEIRQSHQLVIADTGQFWSGLTGELLCASNLVAVVMDKRESTIFSAIKALNLCHRLGIPSARIVCIANRFSTKSKSELARIRNALGTEELYCLADGKAAVDTMANMGRFDEMVESGTVPTDDLEALLANLLPRIGLSYEKPTHKKTRRLFV